MSQQMKCVGPDSEQAGKAKSCVGCINQSACANNARNSGDLTAELVHERLSGVKHVIMVLSGKGGVSCQLAAALANEGRDVGLLDIDICGPSVPQMLGLKGRGIHQSSTGWTPVFVDVGAGTGELGVMSVGFMLPDDDNAVIWRGPRKSGLIRQFLTEVDWGELDYLIIDTPPGTSDEHISVAQYLKMVDIGAIVVTTPQEVSMQDVRKELNFCAKTKIRVIGVLENMNQLLIPLSHLNFVERKTGRDQTEYVRGVLQQCDLQQCDASITIFQCALDNSPQSMAARFNVPYLGALPLDPSLQRACESGTCLVCQCQQHSPAFTPFVRLVDTMLSIITANKAKIPSQA